MAILRSTTIVGSLTLSGPLSANEQAKATNSNFGLVKLGYTANGQNVPLKLSDDGLAYVTVPTTDLSGYLPLTGGTISGNLTVNGTSTFNVSAGNEVILNQTGAVGWDALKIESTTDDEVGISFYNKAANKRFAFGIPTNSQLPGYKLALYDGNNSYGYGNKWLALATENWVKDSYLPLTGGTINGTLKFSASNRNINNICQDGDGKSGLMINSANADGQREISVSVPGVANTWSHVQFGTSSFPYGSTRKIASEEWSTNKFSQIGHTHNSSQITDLTSLLNQKANVTHTHAIGDITSLQSTLDSKLGKTEKAASASTADSATTATQLSGGVASTDNFKVYGATIADNHGELRLEVGDDGGETIVAQCANTSSGGSSENPKNRMYLLDTSGRTQVESLVFKGAGNSTSVTATYGNANQPIYWNNGKPATCNSFASASHTHTISQISNLQSTLDGKASTSHKHKVSDVEGLALDLQERPTRNDFYSDSGSASDEDYLTKQGVKMCVLTELAGQKNGIASLGADGKVPTSQLPTSSGGSIYEHVNMYIEGNSEYLLDMKDIIGGIITVGNYETANNKLIIYRASDTSESTGITDAYIRGDGTGVQIVFTDYFYSFFYTTSTGTQFKILPRISQTNLKFRLEGNSSYVAILDAVLIKE